MGWSETLLVLLADVMLDLGMEDDDADETGLGKAREECDVHVDCNDRVDGAIKFVADVEGGETGFPHFGVDNQIDTDNGSLRLRPADCLKLELTWQGTVRTAAAITFVFASSPGLSLL